MVTRLTGSPRRAVGYFCYNDAFAEPVPQVGCLRLHVHHRSDGFPYARFAGIPQSPRAARRLRRVLAGQGDGPRDRANDRRRHVESPLQPASALRHGVVRNKYVCV